ncbi:hypothetical protein ACVIGB_008681 [Bradyrhizobium sp. USDA 4341]
MLEKSLHGIGLDHSAGTQALRCADLAAQHFAFFENKLRKRALGGGDF